MGIKRKIQIYHCGNSKRPKASPFFFSASFLPPTKKPKWIHSDRSSPPSKKPPWILQTRPSLPPLLPTPYHLYSHSLGSAEYNTTDVLLFRPRNCFCYLPYPQVGDLRILGSLYPQSILGAAPVELRQQSNHSSQHGVFKTGTRRNSHQSAKCYSKQDLLALSVYAPTMKEFQLVCARINFLLDGSGPNARAFPPPSLYWVPRFNQRTNCEFGHRKRHRPEDNSAHSGHSKRFRSLPYKIGRPLFVFQANSIKRPLKISTQGKRRFFFDEKGQPLKRQKLERLCGVVKKNSSLQDMLAIQVQEIGQKKRRRTAQGGPPFSHSKRPKSAHPVAELLSSVFALTFLFIFTLWRLLLYNRRNGRGGSSALSRHAPSPSGSSEVVPQQPSSHP